jgi:uncharacterized protein YecT (DUF1311 family)
MLCAGKVNRRLLVSAAAVIAVMPVAGARADLPDYANFQMPAAAYAAAKSVPYKQCMAQSGGVTSVMRACSAQEHGRLDQGLNRNYRLALARLAAQPRQAELRAHQRAWLTESIQTCDARAMQQGGGGQASLILRDDCLLQEMIRRTQWLTGLR